MQPSSSAVVKIAVVKMSLGAQMDDRDNCEAGPSQLDHWRLSFYNLICETRAGVTALSLSHPTYCPAGLHGLLLWLWGSFGGNVVGSGAFLQYENGVPMPDARAPNDTTIFVVVFDNWVALRF